MITQAAPAFEEVVLRVSGDMLAALAHFSERVGVKKEDCMTVMLGLSEHDRMESATMLDLLMRCQEHIGRRSALYNEVEACISSFSHH